ncbi:hypothetical protein CRUP_032880 [Coryphaenoides rupestris]|nr:hypothetical protein CRUP_032880 [Coryphaenoides rupestris]
MLTTASRSLTKDRNVIAALSTSSSGAAAAEAGPMSSDSSGRASARARMSPTTGVACRRTRAACCSRAHLMELISGTRSGGCGCRLANELSAVQSFKELSGNAACYILALGPLLFVSVFDVWLEKFSTRQAYVINLVSVGVVAFGCTGTAGVIISLSRIFTKLLITDERENTLIFFLVSLAMELLCFLLHLLVRRSRFVRYYTAARGGAGGVAGGGARGQAAKLPDARDDGTGYRVHHDVTAEESEIRNDTLGEWLPILIMATFNMSDFVGKILAAVPYDWPGGRLLFFSALRVVFIPLFVMCVYPASAPTLSHPAWPCLFSLLMGVTNGYFGSVPMILAAGKVPPEQRELAGNTMTVSYMTGLMLGSAGLAKT